MNIIFDKILGIGEKAITKISDGKKQKRELQLKTAQMQHSYLKEKMTSFVFTAAALTFIIPVMFWIMSPILKYIPFMPEILNDYEDIIDTMGMERIFYIICSLLGVGGITKGTEIFGKVKMAVRKQDNDAAIKKEEVKMGVVGDDYVSLKLKGKALPKVKRFINKFAPICIELEKKYDIPAAGVLAHAALETGWGKHILEAYPPKSKEKIATNNVFNIKKSTNWKGKTATLKVWEEIDGHDITSLEEFKVYNSLQDAFDDYALLLTTKHRYKKVTEAGDPEEYVYALKECGYMTDSHAPEKMKKIIDKYFDYET